MNETEELRLAAKLMRERAALVPPPPWHSGMHDVTAGGDGTNVIATSGLTVRAQYVASMHPSVALAVADWLDAEKSVIQGWRECDPLALAVARAYLGTDDSEED